MIERWINIASFFFAFILLFLPDTKAQDVQKERHRMVSLRMVGHQVLLFSGDSTSLVLPIEKENGRYKLQFGTEFGFEPEDLVKTINKAVEETGMAQGYIVEVEQCANGEVVYSYEMNGPEQSDIIPCNSRSLPKSCYNLYITLLDGKSFETTLEYVDLDQSDGTSSMTTFTFIVLLFVLLASAFYYFRQKRLKPKADSNICRIGEYQFDKRSSELQIEDQKIELSGKESDLLVLLYDSANTTVEREVILNTVWGDDGGYVGRTLDVFISKLRKKLQADTKVKIVNIRGIGYKLVVDV